MNQCLVDLFNDQNRSARLVSGLPIAFEQSKLEVPPSNPAVGFLREYAITGFFMSEFGRDNVKLPDSGVRRGFDLHLCGHELSIKTVTNNGSVKVVWTVDSYQIGREIASEYKPTCDILLINIYWGKVKDSIFYIPISVQNEVFDNLGGEKYLIARIGTNHRGISISGDAMKALKQHDATLKLAVNWQTRNLQHTPYDRWFDFWRKI